MIHQTDHYDGGALTSSERWDDVALTYTLLDGTGKVTSTRPFTAAETTFYAAQTTATQAVAAAAANTTTLLAKPAPAVTANIAYQAVAVPTPAQQLAQVAALTAQANALLRLAAGLTASTSGT